MLLSKSFSLIWTVLLAIVKLRNNHKVHIFENAICVVSLAIKNLWKFGWLLPEMDIYSFKWWTLVKKLFEILIATSASSPNQAQTVWVYSVQSLFWNTDDFFDGNGKIWLKLINLALIRLIHTHMDQLHDFKDWFIKNIWTKERWEFLQKRIGTTTY